MTVKWVTSRVNGNVIKVTDDALAAKFKAEGHEVSDTDPRQKPKAKPKR